MKEELQPYKMIFGWEDDEGIGEMLISQILKGEKTATCAPKDEYTEQELRDTYEPVGQILTVYDKFGKARCKVKLLEVFETTFGSPDPRLVRGEGNGDDTAEFQRDHRLAWKNIATDLRDDTVLIVELFERVLDE